MSNKTFSLKRKTEKITLQTDSGDVVYTLKEMSAAVRDDYLQKLSKRVTNDADGKPTGVSDFAGMQAELIQSCITKKDGGAVAKDDIQEWPSSAVTGVYNLCQEMNGLSQAAVEDGASKNE